MTTKPDQTMGEIRILSMTTKPTITIDKNVPIPPRYGSKWKSNLLAMAGGDSFKVANACQRDAVMSSAKHAGVKITTRKLNGSGYRIWRIK